MKKFLLTPVLIVTAFLTLITNSQCKKESLDTFCKIQRSTYNLVNNKEGMIVYSNKYDRYGVSFNIGAPNNIDSQIIGLVCSLKPTLKSVGLQIVFSGVVKEFNANENMSAEIAGQNLYFLEISKIAKK